MAKKIIAQSELLQLYVIEERSLRYIGNIYNMAPDTVKARLIENNIILRDTAAWIRGKTQTVEHTKAIVKSLTGKKHTIERKMNQSLARIKFFKNGGKNWNDGLTKETHPSLKRVGARKENHWAWNNGISELSANVRSSSKYNRWKNDCLTRDQQCVRCNSNEKLVVHHIIRFGTIMENIKNYNAAMNNEELFDINNGITLCSKCHSDEHRQERILILDKINGKKEK